MTPETLKRANEIDDRLCRIKFLQRKISEYEAAEANPAGDFSFDSLVLIVGGEIALEDKAQMISNVKAKLSSDFQTLETELFNL